MGGKHAPIELGRYIDIHETAMRCLERDSHYVLPGGDGLAIDRAAGGLLIEGRIGCVGGILIDVTKLLAIWGDGPGAIVQTQRYSYHVSLEGMGNVMRYDSPHDTPEQPDHHPYHHKHTYDVLNGDARGNVTEVDAEGRPTLAEVISEACVWYFENAEAIETRRRKT